MEELSKKDILSLIGENITTVRHSGYKGFDEGVELEEMPIHPGHSQWPTSGKEPDPNKPAKSGKDKGKLPKWTRLYETDEEGKITEHVGWYGRNPDTDEAVPIVYTCNWDAFIESHPDLIPKLKEKFGNVNLIEGECPDYKPRADIKSYGIKPIPGSDEVVKVTDTKYTPTVDDEGNFKTTYTKEKINRTFNKILKEKIQDDQELNDGLKRLSLPRIVIDKRKHRNDYSVVNDKEITFESHNIHVYPTQREFIMDVNFAVRTDDLSQIEDRPDKPLRRLYNQVYSNWPKTRFTSSKQYGKTPVFKLDKYDFPNEQKFEVMISSDVKIIGKATETNEEGETTKWSWEVNYLAEYAKKKPTDNVARKLIRDAEINKVVEVELSEPKKFDGKTEVDAQGGIIDGDTGSDHPLTDINIVEGLKQAIQEFKEEILSTDPTTAIRRAIVTIQDMGNRETTLNESDIKDIVKKVIKENK